MKRKSTALLVGLFCLGLFLVACTTKQSTSTTKDSTSLSSKISAEKPEKTAVPTLFLHGYGGTVNSFGGMIKRLAAAGDTKNELILTVALDGSIRSKGALSGQKNNPSVQVLFADNKNNEWNQTEWIKSALEFLQTNYQVTQVNLVGHSMGGVSGLRYLGTYGANSDLPQVEKFVSIGAPFNDFIDTSAQQTIAEELKNGPTEVTDRYQDYQQLVESIPTTIPFLLIGGQLSETELSDGPVPLTSA